VIVGPQNEINSPIRSDSDRIEELIEQLSEAQIARTFSACGPFWP
jgi:hypothetical protein